MAAFAIECSYALFQCKQAFINFRTFQSSLPIVWLGVLSTLRAGQVDDKQFTNAFALLIFYFNLTYSMGPTRSVVSRSAMGSSLAVSKLYNFIHFFFWAG